jgi:hypothetical protein
MKGLYEGRKGVGKRIMEVTLLGRGTRLPAKRSQRALKLSCPESSVLRFR